ncbi:DUF305 domain-containing protein [Micromonospora sp. DR5-3]|uniref:DUF305 domain-containing protein n=1 Tax=unclassified Micromonospora TaxID=2617518 RepID=UPI0011D391FA|nr:MULTISPECIES: DUF305 domain-containing protein [unclassified Micromonospora]MCW3815146.1 DUF305 domain-containing protein [Micromonospora sp. DR5-3]TYC22027.1 DUF305 domain-containing protein [Micromonospora sp. MP36]
MTGRQARIWAAVTGGAVLLVALGLALSRAGDGGAVVARAPAPNASSTVDAPPVIVPGRPGESATTRPGQEVRNAESARYNSLDVWFVRMMIPHHQQAVEMAALATDRAADPRVRAVAERIRAAQGPEIGVLRGWLGARGLPAEVSGHDHGTMRGMQPPEAMRQLAAARGAEFDRRFVRMMTEHHQGAVAMATDLLRVGADQTMQEFANAVATEQSAEIARLHDLVAP